MQTGLQSVDLQRIADWLATVAKTQVWSHEIHIDQLPTIGDRREYWLNGSLHALVIATRLKDSQQLPQRIALRIDLENVESPEQVSSLERLNAAIGIVPPALYALPEIARIELLRHATPLQIEGVGPSFGRSYFHLETSEGGDGSYPSVFILSGPAPDADRCSSPLIA